MMRLASGDKSTEGQLYDTFKPLALQWIKAAKSPGHIDGEMKNSTTKRYRICSRVLSDASTWT
jgi:hypothetical protein